MVGRAAFHGARVVAEDFLGVGAADVDRLARVGHAGCEWWHQHHIQAQPWTTWGMVDGARGGASSGVRSGGRWERASCAVTLDVDRLELVCGSGCEWACMAMWSQLLVGAV